MITIKQDYVMVEPISMKQKQVGSLFVVADIEDRKVQRGKVIGVGDGVMPDGTTHPVEVKVGETVVFPAHTGHTTKMDNTEYLLMREVDILGVLED